MTYGVFGRFTALKLSALVAAIAVPAIASAGFFSFVSGLFSDAEASIATSGGNSQTMAILEADITPSFNTSLGGAELSIVDGNALMSESGPSNAEGKDTVRPGRDQISMYVVRSGDNLSQIADMYGVSVNTIVWTNNLKSRTVKEGQVLVILPVSGVRHTVKGGDTIESIAKKYKGDADEIRSYNDIGDGAKLAAGSIVIIPDGEIASDPVRTTSGTSRIASGSSLPSIAGYFMRPLSGGRRSQGIHGYNGVDLAAPVGTTIYAAAGGNVILSRSGGWNGGYGTYIVIAHDNGTQTLYAHNSSNIVSVGQRVVQGQVIGYVGNTGKSTGPHLHFEVRGAKNPF